VGVYDQLTSFFSNSKQLIARPTHLRMRTCVRMSQKLEQLMLASISCSNLSYVFPDGAVLFECISFSIHNRKVGLVGANGAGKTTLLKIIQGELEPLRGTVRIQGQTEVLCQRATKISGETVGDVLGVNEILRAVQSVEAGAADPALLDEIGDKWAIREQISAVMQQLKIEHLSLIRPMDTLSGGESVKVHLARILLKTPSVLLLDEPTNNIDSEGRAVLYDFIENWKGCLLVVSHDRELLSRVDAIFELSNRGLQEYGGNYEFYDEVRKMEASALEQRLVYAEQRIKREKRELQRNHERQEKRMSRGQKVADKGSLPKIIAGGLKRKAQVTMAKSKATHEDQVYQAVTELQLVREKIKERNIIKVDIPETRVPNGKIIFQIQDFNFRFTDAARFLFNQALSFTLYGARRVAISGGNGAGKSTLIRLLLDSMGLLPDRLTGERVGRLDLKSDRISYLDQRVDILEDNLTLLENFSKVTPHLSESDRRIRLGRFLFDRNAVSQKVVSLSGGERLRAGLACVLFSEKPPQLLILDEPTNNLDLDSIERIESALSNFEGAMLVVSHDGRFLENIGVEDEIHLGESTNNFAGLFASLRIWLPP